MSKNIIFVPMHHRHELLDLSDARYRRTSLTSILKHLTWAFVYKVVFFLQEKVYLSIMLQSPPITPKNLIKSKSFVPLRSATILTIYQPQLAEPPIFDCSRLVIINKFWSTSLILGPLILGRSGLNIYHILVYLPI
jgi:hypothetical protein